MLGFRAWVLSGLVLGFLDMDFSFGVESTGASPQKQHEVLHPRGLESRV